ncbi:MAG: adenylosuccinate lyase [Bdellovibrionales bacterium]|nr:adenylosuccinate lyase [Bdellovibrionales bacterium]
MIARYDVKQVSDIWSEESRLKHLLEVEMALMQAQEELGIIPADTHKAYAQAQIKPDRVLEIEKTTRHDVIAFCTSITEQIPTEQAKYFHYGVTSSDILDTALSLQVRRSMEIVVTSLRSVVTELAKKVEATSDILALGRSHGMAAEPMIFGQKFLSFQAEFERRLHDYEQAMITELTGQISGAVGNYTVVTPELEMKTLQRLKLRVESVSTQVIPRDRIAKIIAIGALIATAIERLAVEIRHLHHSDIAELHEGFTVGQKGSSTMPHKKNPISGENLSGLARILRSHVEVAMENCILWHERDISHSSAERLYLPDHFGILTYSLQRLATTISNLEIHKESVESKVEKHFQTLSSLVLHELIKINNVTRETLYSLVQAASFQSSSLKDFLSKIEAAAKGQGLKVDLSKLNLNEIKAHYKKRFEAVRARFKK